MSVSAAPRASVSGPSRADPDWSIQDSLLPRLSHALTRINRTAARTIASPPTQPRRASVAILIRVRPHPDDDEWLAEQYDGEGQPLPGSEAERIMMQSGLGLGTATDESAHIGRLSSDSRDKNKGEFLGEGQTTGSGRNEVKGDESLSESRLGAEVSTETLQRSIETSSSAIASSGDDVSILEASGLTNAESAVDLGGLSTGELSAQSRASKEGQPTSASAASSSPQTLDPSSVGSRGVSSDAASDIDADTTNQTMQRFFSLPWVQRGTPEVLYIKRASRSGDKWSAHVAFPGGRREEGDENGLYTAMRETWEEVGLDLAEREFCCVGQLDDREITTSLGKRLLMVLSPYLFVQTSPFSPIPDLQPTEVASAHWIPLSLLYTPSPRWGITSVDIASRLAPKSPAVRWALRALVGKMDFRCILLPNMPIAVAAGLEEEEEDANSMTMSPTVRREKGLDDLETALGEDGQRPELRLWGLTLGMTLDLLSHMSTFNTTIPSSSRRQQLSRYEENTPLPGLADLIREPVPTAWNIIGHIRDELHLSPPPQATALAPSMTSVFPRFSYPDVNFWIWVFGWRYRAVVRGWERGIGTGMERSVNWSGMALGAFYSAVRRALVVAIVLRALGFVSAFGTAGWLVGRRLRRRARGLDGWGLEEIFGSLRET